MVGQCADAPKTPEQDAAELTRYDKKVHRACTDMVNATTRELKTLGIPFFGIPPSLLVQDEADNAAVPQRRELETVGANIKNTDKSKLRQTEVVGLQKRMLELLEDLCKD